MKHVLSKQIFAYHTSGPITCGGGQEAAIAKAALDVDTCCSQGTTKLLSRVFTQKAGSVIRNIPGTPYLPYLHVVFVMINISLMPSNHAHE